MPVRTRAFACLVGLRLVPALYVQKVETEAETVRESALLRFRAVDADRDDVVTMEELKRAFHHESPDGLGLRVLGQMMAHCAGKPLGTATSCTRHQFEKAFDAWAEGEQSGQAKHAMSLLQVGSTRGKPPPIDVSEPTGDPCGPSLEKPVEGEEQPVCSWDGAKCFKEGTMGTWLQKAVCHHKVCRCLPTTATKRVAKLGVMGSLSIFSLSNVTDPDDQLMPPACGGNWKTRRVFGNLTNMQKMISAIERRAVDVGLKNMIGNNKTELDQIKEADFDVTEVGIFKSDRQQLEKGGPLRKVCMITWQGTRDAGDWLNNAMALPKTFPYSRKGTEYTTFRGITLAYESVRDKLHEAFQEECCTAEFQADRLVVSGHSHGGAMAELNAIDVISHWHCGGRDLGRKDVSVILVAPHSYNLPASIDSSVFSCASEAHCLAGSVAVLTTEGDIVGERAPAGYYVLSAPRHPAYPVRLPCPKMPEGIDWYLNASRCKRFWCHAIENYVDTVEETLVDKLGWGSTCAGECGNPNRQVQCNQYAMINKAPCHEAEVRLGIEAPKPTSCLAEHWQADKEKCACPRDTCLALTGTGKCQV